MRFRLGFSQNSLRGRRVVASLATAIAMLSGSGLLAQDNSAYHTDPATGIVFRKVQRTIERPVVETQMRTQESTVYRPETVVTNRPETRTVYAPVVSYSWEPKLQNRWNPFSQPTVVYQHTPRVHWEARSETIDRLETRTNYVAETRKVDVPQQIVRIQREEKVDFEPVGRVAPQQAAPPNSTGNSDYAAVAARLRPMGANPQFTPLYGSSQPIAGTAGYPQRRNEFQSGMRANELYPTQTPGYGVAGLPMPQFR